MNVFIVFPCANVMFLFARFKMSWLFGMNQRPQDFSQFVPPPAGGAGGDQGGAGDSGDGKRSGAMDAYRFDSSALERAAKAAKELEKSGVCDLFPAVSGQCHGFLHQSFILVWN